MRILDIYNSRLQPCWLYASTNGALAVSTSCTATDPGPGNILDLKYSFNVGAGDNGNVIGITNNRDTTRTQSFSYDQVNRIVTAQTSATTGTNCWGETYTMDQWANMTAIGALSGYTGCTQETLGVSATTSNQLSATGFTFDPSGNMLTDGLNTYGWNAESEIKSAAGVNYTYDGDGNRLQKSNGKIYWYGAGTAILDESDASGNFTNEYVFFGGKRIAMRNVSSGTIYYYAEDVLGSSRTLVQAGQTSVCYDADFYPFGGERDIVSTCTQNYKFEGKERDTETNNDDFGARYYSSRFGRWLSADWSAVPAPVPYANLTNPQTLNLYAMVRDNPETFADLDGHVLDNSADPTRKGPSGGIDDGFENLNPSSDDGGGDPHTTTQNAQTAQPQAQTQNSQPAPTNPDGSPKAPPTTDNKGNPIVPGVEGWKLGPGSAGGDRDKRWAPSQPVPADPSKGQGQPNASWDPHGHWDVKTGKKGETVRVLPDGTRVDHYNNPMKSSVWNTVKSMPPGPVARAGTAAIIIYIIVSEGSRLYPPRNLVPVP